MVTTNLPFEGDDSNFLRKYKNKSESAAMDSHTSPCRTRDMAAKLYSRILVKS